MLIRNIMHVQYVTIGQTFAMDWTFPDAVCFITMPANMTEAVMFGYVNPCLEGIKIVLITHLS